MIKEGKQKFSGEIFSPNSLSFFNRTKTVLHSAYGGIGPQTPSNFVSRQSYQNVPLAGEAVRVYEVFSYPCWK